MFQRQRTQKANKPLAVILVSSLLLSGCKDNRLDKIAKGLDEAAHAVAILQTTVINAQAQGLISEATTRNILLACVSVNEAGKKAVAVTRSINELDPSTQTSLMAIINPVLTAVNGLVANGTISIQDEATKQKVQLLLVSLQTTLNAVHLTIAAGGN